MTDILGQPPTPKPKEEIMRLTGPLVEVEFDPEGTALSADVATAGLVGIGVGAEGVFYSMDVGGLEREGPAAETSEVSDIASSLTDLRRTVTLTTNGSGVATLAHERGAIPTGVVVSSNSNARQVTWSQSNSDADVIAFFARTVSDGSLYVGTVSASVIAWWD